MGNTGKDSLRTLMQGRRVGLTDAWVVAHSADVQAHVVASSEFARADAVACYFAMKTEVATAAIISRCRRDGKRVCVPALRPADRDYALCWLETDTETRPGRWDIPEPVEPAWIDDERVDLMIVPGVAFDLRGGRLGHGCGYYDRMAASAAARHATRFGMAFEFQVVEHVPMLGHDVRMDAVATENGVFRTGG